MRHALHRPADLHLHPSALTLSEYPTVGGGAADLVFTVTYAGDMQPGGAEDSAESPVVRLDVTGSEYRDLYRVTNITSNIETATPDDFEPYDHEAETARAEQGVTYTVRATIEFVAEGFIPVYALGFDGDIVTVNVAASELESMSYTEYVATRQSYLDNASDVSMLNLQQVSVPAHAKPSAGSLSALYPFSLSSAESSSKPLTESNVELIFNATGNVMVENATGEFMPVHGIWVCVYDRSPSLYDIRLNTTSGEMACDYTDRDGKYAIPNVSGIDPDDMSAADVIVSVLSYGYGGVIDLGWYHPIDREVYSYYADSDLEADHRNVSLVKDFNLSDGDIDDVGMASAGMAGAARIISAMSDGMAFFEEYGQKPESLAVGWNYMDGSSIFPGKDFDGGAYLQREVRGVAIIWLDGNSSLTYDESYDRHTILHELGHHVHFVHDPELEYACSIHTIHEKYDEACAWGEGWAEIVPHLVADSTVLPIGVRGEVIDIEAGRRVLPDGTAVPFGTFETSGRPVGEKVEGSVAAAMWDMADEVADPRYDTSLAERPAGADDSSAGVDGLLGIFFADTYDNFADFYDRWEIDMRHDSAENIAILHGMSFAIPSNMSYYGFAGELDGVFKYGVSNLVLQPNYVDVSDDGSTVAITSLNGRALQLVDVRAGEHKGLHASYGYDYVCTLVEDPLACMDDTSARSMLNLGPSGFSSMDGIAFGPDSRVVLVSDGHQNRVQLIGSDGIHIGSFGAPGNGSGEFNTPDGIAFLPRESTVAVADAINRRVQTFTIADNGSAQYDNQFTSYSAIGDLPSSTFQQLAADPGGTLYAAGYEQLNVQPSMWLYPQPHTISNATRIDDTSLSNLGGIAVDRDGLVYVSDPSQGRIRVYDPDNLRGTVEYTTSQLGGRPLNVIEVQGGMDLGSRAEAYIDEFGSLGQYTWQLGRPLGVALGPPDDRTGDVRVYVADLNGVKMYEKDRVGPRVESVWAHTVDGTVIPGDTVEIAVNFSERVTVTGTPIIALDTGVDGSFATYVSGSGSHTLTFNHTIGTGASPQYLDYEGTRSLSFGGGGDILAAFIVDGSGNAANLTLPERGTAASLAANAALWIGENRMDAALFGIEAMVPFEATEHRQIMFTVATADDSAPAAAGSYLIIDGPQGATISHNGTFTWMPEEAQDGMHVFAIRALMQGDPNTSHTRTIRILVDEDNTLPRIDSVYDRLAVALSEIRFKIDTTDEDLPEQNLEYRLASNPLTFATVLPNGTFVWTPSEYDMGTTTFNMSVTDGFSHGSRTEQDFTTVVEFSIVVGPSSPSLPLRVYALTNDVLSTTQVPVYTAKQTIRIGVDFSEPVVVRSSSSGGTPYIELGTGAASVGRAPYDSGSGTKTLVFAYEVRDGDATDRLSYAGTGALALNGSAITVLNSGEAASTALPEAGSLGSLSESSLIRIDAVRPAVESVYALVSDGTYGEGEQVDIAARFSENVTVGGSPAIALETGATDRDAMYLSGNSTDTLVFRYTVQAGDNASRLDYAGTDALKVSAGGYIRDGVGNNAVLALPTLGGQGSLGHNSNITIGIAIMNETAGNSVTLNIGRGDDTGLISVVDNGDGARITLNLRGIVGPGGSGTATFPPDGVTVNASFASVTFAPGATATSVPADNVLVLYVADSVPDNSSVQRVLGYDGLNPVVLQRVVEIGDEDARIEFNAPVRISLEGLAGGRAFYVDGAGGAITPIDKACAADDLQRVQRQLDGAGECQLDSDGGDKIIYTYHLTRFGTVLSESGTPAVPDHTCSMRLALSSLEVENARPGVDSPDASQTVVNSGSLPFDRIELEATPWYVDLGGAEPGPDTRSLNASITEVREEEGGAYRTVYSRGTVVADGLGGGLEAPLWFRLNLAAHGDVHGVDLTQYVTYVAECGGPAERR